MAYTRRNALEMIGGTVAVAGAMASANAAPPSATARASAPKTRYWVATVTPTNAAGVFDPGAMRAIMQWHQQAGADGVVVLGTSGEFPSFSMAERKIIAEAALKNKGKLDVMVGPGTSNISETIELPKHAESHGADGLLVIPPFYFNAPPLAGLSRYYAMLFDAVKIPINLYHIPGTSEVPISVELLDTLKHYTHLAGIKDSSGSAEGYAKFLTSFPMLNMRCGTNNNLEAALGAGMGTILADGNMWSSKCAAILTAYRGGGDWQTALQKLRAAQKIMREATQGVNQFAAMKTVLGLQMGTRWYARPPYDQANEAQINAMKTALARVKNEIV